MENNLLYDSKGASKKLLTFYIILAFTCIALGIGSFMLSNAKYDSETVTSGFVDSDGNFHVTNTGTLGGGDMLTKDGKQMFRILGFICIALSFMLFSMRNSYRRCWVKIYEDHIEGQAFSYGKQKNQFYCAASDIQSTILSNFNIVLQLPSTKYVLVCEDLKKANDVLQTLIRKN